MYVITALSAKHFINRKKFPYILLCLILHTNNNNNKRKLLFDSAYKIIRTVQLRLILY